MTEGKGREGCTEKIWNRHVMVLPVANRLQSTTEVILTDFILNRRVEAVLAWHTGPKLHTGLLFITVSFKTRDRFRDSVASRLRSLDSFLHHMVFNILFNVHRKLLVAKINPKTIVLKINILSHADSGCQSSKKKKKKKGNYSLFFMCGPFLQCRSVSYLVSSRDHTKTSVFLVAKLLVVLNILVSADPERPSNRAHVV